MRRLASILLLSAGSLLAAGCLERTETINVTPDGAVTLRTVLRGDPDEFGQPGGDPMPEAGGIWNVTDERDVDHDNKPRLTRTCDLTVKAGEPLPASYAAAGDHRIDVCLKFPTSLTIEKRPDGTYYHFRRTYQHREEARYTYMQHALIDQGSPGEPSVKSLLERDASELSDKDRERLVTTLRRVELDKQLQCVENATQALPPNLQDACLKVRAAAVAAAEKFDLNKALSLLSQPPSDARDKSIADLAQNFTAEIRMAIDRAVSASGLGPRELSAVRDAIVGERLRRSITEDLSDERWTVRVTLPGKIVASNADSIEGATAVWEFTALAIQDRDQTLMVTSVVKGDAK